MRMISIEKLYFKHSKKHQALFEDLNCEIEAGSIVGLLGKNGAGKTTLLKILTGLLNPMGGSINIYNHRPIKRDPSFLEEIFFVSEEFVLPAISVDSFVRINHKFYPRFDHETYTKLLSEFELPKTKNLNKLSYGQKKKFLITFAISTKCKLLIFDEPTNGLDIPSKSVFRKVIAGSLNDDQLVIISTHQVKDVENLIDKLFLLDDGKFILQKDLFEISSKLNFKFSPTNEGSNILYSEMVPGGYKLITTEASGHSQVDIELLFNAITEGNQNIKDYVNE